RTALRTRHPAMGGRGAGPAEPEYPPPGALLDYYLSEEVVGDLKLEILDQAGRVIRTQVSRPSEAVAGSPAQGMRGPVSAGRSSSELTRRPGLNRYLWDLRLGEATPSGGGRELPGPLALPGRYTIRLTTAKWTLTQPLVIELDPRLARDGVTIDDLREQLELIQKVRQSAREAAGLVQRIDRELAAAPLPRQTILRQVRQQLVTASGAYPQPMLIDQLGSIYRLISDADRKVGRSAIEYYDELRRELDRLAGLLTGN
ncbi:MAG: hypothetical protein ACKOB4_14465, partial [Acidobacteriota bacterium]